MPVSVKKSRVTTSLYEKKKSWTTGHNTGQTNAPFSCTGLSSRILPITTPKVHFRLDGGPWKQATTQRSIVGNLSDKKICQATSRAMSPLCWSHRDREMRACHKKGEMYHETAHGNGYGLSQKQKSGATNHNVICGLALHDTESHSR